MKRSCCLKCCRAARTAATIFLGWRPMSYREHFEVSNFKGRALAIAAYEAADPNLRFCLDTLAGTMTAVLEATRAAMGSDNRAANRGRARRTRRRFAAPAGRARRRGDQRRGDCRGRRAGDAASGGRPADEKLNGGRANLSAAPLSRGQRGHHPRRQGAGGAARAQTGARRLHAAGRRGGNRRDAGAGGDARGARGDALEIEPVALAGHREAIVRDAQGARRTAFRHPVLCRALAFRRADAQRRTRRRALARSRRACRACAPPRAWPKSSPRRSSGWRGRPDRALRLPQSEGISAATSTGPHPREDDC